MKTVIPEVDTSKFHYATKIRKCKDVLSADCFNAFSHSHHGMMRMTLKPNGLLSRLVEAAKKALEFNLVSYMY
jgi:hypothetical protein